MQRMPAADAPAGLPQRADEVLRNNSAFVFPLFARRPGDAGLQELAVVVGSHLDADPATAELMTWLDVQLKRNIVLTFGGGVNEVQRELIAMAGLGLPRAPR